MTHDSGPLGLGIVPDVFEVKCDDCKRTMRKGSLKESYEGGICDSCRLEPAVTKFNRGVLLRQAKKGMFEGRVSQRMTDDYAYDAASNFGRTEWMPVRIITEHADSRTGYLNLWESDFKTKTGGAYRMRGDPPGEITFLVHSNEYLRLRRRL